MHSPRVKTHLRGKRFGFGEKRGAGFAFERRTIEAAANFQFRAGKDGRSACKLVFDAAHVRDAERAKVEDGVGTLGDDVHASAAFDDVGVDGHAACAESFHSWMRVSCRESS